MWRTATLCPFRQPIEIRQTYDRLAGVTLMRGLRGREADSAAGPPHGDVRVDMGFEAARPPKH